MRKEGRLLPAAGTGCFSRTSRVLRMERGLAEDDVMVLSLMGLKRRKCASCAACEEGDQMLSAADREGAAPCSDSTLDGTAARLRGTSCNADTRLASPWMN